MTNVVEFVTPELLRKYIDYYLSIGLSIIPVKITSDKGDRLPLISWTEYQTRQPTKAEVDDWFAKFKMFNIAMVCGRVSGYVVLDFDKYEAFDLFCKKYNADPHLISMISNIVISSEGHRHLYCKLANKMEIIKSYDCNSNGDNKNFGFEVKGEHSLVTLPPSKHWQGHYYKWGHQLNVMSDNFLEALTTETPVFSATIETIKNKLGLINNRGGGLNLNNNEPANTPPNEKTPNFPINATAFKFKQHCLQHIFEKGVDEGSRNYAFIRLLTALKKHTPYLRKEKIYEIMLDWNTRNRPSWSEQIMKYQIDHEQKEYTPSCNFFKELGICQQNCDPSCPFSPGITSAELFTRITKITQYLNEKDEPKTIGITFDKKYEFTINADRILFAYVPFQTFWYLTFKKRVNIKKQEWDDFIDQVIQSETITTVRIIGEKDEFVVDFMRMIKDLPVADILDTSTMSKKNKFVEDDAFLVSSKRILMLKNTSIYGRTISIEKLSNLLCEYTVPKKTANDRLRKVGNNKPEYFWFFYKELVEGIDGN